MKPKIPEDLSLSQFPGLGSSSSGTGIGESHLEEAKSKALLELEKNWRTLRKTLPWTQSQVQTSTKFERQTELESNEMRLGNWKLSTGVSKIIRSGKLYN